MLSTTAPSDILPLSRYKHSLRRIETLTAEAERALARKWRDNDSAAGAQLVTASLPFVIRIAREYRRWGIPLEDLVQQGNLGLLKAARKFDLEKECRLVTYAVYWIRAEIREYVVRSYRIVRLGTTRTERKAIRRFRRLGAESPEALAEQSGMPVARAKKLWPLLSHGDVSLDRQVMGRPSAIDRIDSNMMTPEAIIARQMEVEGVKKALGKAFKQLSKREVRIVQARMMADEPKTLAALGKEMGVSKERVRQLEARVRKKLREQLSEFRPAA